MIDCNGGGEEADATAVAMYGVWVQGNPSECAAGHDENIERHESFCFHSRIADAFSR